MNRQNAHARERKQDGEESIGNTLSRALIVSLLAHLVLLAWLRMPAVNEPGEPSRLRVRLQRPPPPPPRPVPSAPPAEAPMPVPLPPQRAASEDATPANKNIDWHAEARAVARTSPDFNPLVAREPDRPGFGVSPPGALARAFKPPPRPMEICGRMATLVIGDRRIDVPISYLCEDKSVEYRTAPAAGRLIGEPESDDPAQR